MATEYYFKTLPFYTNTSAEICHTMVTQNYRGNFENQFISVKPSVKIGHRALVKIHNRTPQILSEEQSFHFF